jgi:hypothetical protein
MYAQIFFLHVYENPVKDFTHSHWDSQENQDKDSLNEIPRALATNTSKK